jgi:chromosome partitioning protein
MTVYHVFQALYSAQTVFPVPEVQQTPIGIDLLPADPRLSGVAAEKLPTSNNIRANNQLLFRHLGIMREVLKPHIENYDYILIDTHPETSELMRTVIYASDYAISPVKLDEQSSVGVPSAIEAVNAVNEDVAALGGSLNVPNDYSPTQYAGAIGMMAREWGVRLKRTERSQYRRLGATGGIFEAYVTEGDGIRKAAEQRCPVYDIGGANAKKQTAQFRDVVTEFLDKCV